MKGTDRGIKDYEGKTKRNRGHNLTHIIRVFVPLHLKSPRQGEPTLLEARYSIPRATWYAQDSKSLKVSCSSGTLVTSKV